MARVKVIKEDKNGRNTKFRDTKTGEEMTRSQFVKAIESEKYPGYHIRNINGVKTPVSNPDSSDKNNLG